MLYGNQMSQALVSVGLKEKPKEKKKKLKTFKCKKCNSDMLRPENTNTMICPKCGNYFLFEK